MPSTLTRAELTATASTLPKPSLGGQGGGEGGLEVGIMGEEGCYGGIMILLGLAGFAITGPPSLPQYTQHITDTDTDTILQSI